MKVPRFCSRATLLYEIASDTVRTARLQCRTCTPRRASSFGKVASTQTTPRTSTPTSRDDRRGATPRGCLARDACDCHDGAISTSRMISLSLSLSPSFGILLALASRLIRTLHRSQEKKARERERQQREAQRRQAEEAKARAAQPTAYAPTGFGFSNGASGNRVGVGIGRGQMVQQPSGPSLPNSNPNLNPAQAGLGRQQLQQQQSHPADPVQSIISDVKPEEYDSVLSRFFPTLPNNTPGQPGAENSLLGAAPKGILQRPGSTDLPGNRTGINRSGGLLGNEDLPILGIVPGPPLHLHHPHHPHHPYAKNLSMPSTLPSNNDGILAPQPTDPRRTPDFTVGRHGTPTPTAAPPIASGAYSFRSVRIRSHLPAPNPHSVLHPLACLLAWLFGC